MLESTEAVLSSMGNAYVAIAQRELGVLREVTSKTTGKKYRKRIDNTGNLRNSFRTVNIGQTDMRVLAADYAEEVSTGERPQRPPAVNDLEQWIRNKPYRFRSKNGQFIERTDKMVTDFARNLQRKIFVKGVDQTNYLEGITETVAEKFSKELTNAIVEDTAKGITEIINRNASPNTNAETI